MEQSAHASKISRKAEESLRSQPVPWLKAEIGNQRFRMKLKGLGNMGGGDINLIGTK